MDARAGTFQALELFGQQLLQGGHYASVDIQEKLNNMGDARQDLEKSVAQVSFSFLCPHTFYVYCNF